MPRPFPHPCPPGAAQHRAARAGAALLAAVIIAGCAPPEGLAIPVPAIETAGAWPELEPVGPVLAAAEAGAARARTSATEAAGLDARAAALRARAAGLRRDVVAAPVRSRMGRGVDTAALP